jgi:hypothetical protein
MKHWWWVVGAAATVLASCSAEDSLDEVIEQESKIGVAPEERLTSDEAVAATPAGELLNSTSRELTAASPQTQRSSLRQMMETSGKQCGDVSEVTYVASNAGTDAWKINCAETGKWLVYLKPDGRTKVLSCQVVAAPGGSCDHL